MTREEGTWYDLLDELIAREGFSRPQVARRSGVSTKTIASWLRGDVQSPRRWQPLARVLRALSASTNEANDVFEGASHPPLQQLARRADDEDRTLLRDWLQADVPFMPPDRPVRSLVGRQAQLAQVAETLQRQRRCVLLGMAGVGKTTLAIELAHQLRHEYADGVFWGDLGTGVADAVLESWGQACGVPMERLTDFNSRAATMRAVFARKEALIVVDDVTDGRQALQMIPAQNLNCAVLATTRSADVAQTLTRMQEDLVTRLQPLHRENSLALIASILGEDVLAQARESAGEIAALLGDMPLALHICAALCTDAGLSLQQMAVLLRDMGTRLERLRLEQKPLVHLAFEQSWALLDEHTQRALATLGLFAGRPFGVAAFAASAGLSEPEATLLLARLYRLSLLAMDAAEDQARQYRQHTLLAAFSAEKLGQEDQAWARFSAYYARVTGESGWKPAQTAGAWGNIMAAMEAAHRLQDWSLVLTYTTQLAEAWRRQGLYSLARQGYAWARDAARETADVRAEAQIRLEWGRACLEQSDYAPAREQLTQALRLFTAEGLTAGVAETQYHLARVEMELSHHDAAEQAIQEAYGAYQQEEDTRGMARALYQLGFIIYFRGDYERAAPLAEDAIRNQQQSGDDLDLLRSYRLATQVYTQLGRIDEAERHYQAAARLVEQVDDRAELAAFYYTYADVLRQKEAFEEAQKYGREALALFREMADGSSQVNALLLLAGNEVYWNDAQPQRQQFEVGLSYCREALAVCEAVDYELGKAFVLLIKGRLLAQQDRRDAACTVWVESLAMAQALQHAWLQQRLQTLIDESRCPSSPDLPRPRSDPSGAL